MIAGDDIRRIKLQLAPPSVILGWSHGEITESETINYRTHRAERGGLYAEEIFGPANDYECACGKYKGKKYEGITCEKCHVLVTDSSVRRINMGHIQLASPVVHFWFLKGVSSLLSRLLGLKRRELQRIAYYETEPLEQALYIVTTSESKDVRPGESLYTSEHAILSQALSFEVEPAYYIDEAPRVLAEEGGRVTIEERQLTNGERIRSVIIGGQEYPMVGDAEIMLEDGDEVEADTVIAERPVGEMCSKTAYDMLVDRYGAVTGEALDREVLDSLAFIVTRIKGRGVSLSLGDRVTYLEKRAYERIYPDGFTAETGAAGIKGILESLDIEGLYASLTEELRQEKGIGNQRRLMKRLEVVDQLRRSGNNPQDMILEVIPVLPPDLRPMIQLEGGKFATTDLNDLYRRIINRNNRLKKLVDMGAPEVILRNERRMLQEAVDALIHNEKKESPIRGRDNRPLKSLSERIHGKHGRLRRNLLGRRVDYSGRAVIVVDPKLKLAQCGIPKKMALELFKPFILHYLETTTFSDFDEIKNRALMGEMPEVWDILDKLIKKHPVLLNRAPTLHRLSMQAFEPVLVDGEAIHVHPLVCPPYNADFDGDTMSVHLPLSPEAIREARELMAAPRNILSPSSGEPITLPTQDPIFAFYYLTLEEPEGKGKGKAFRDIDEARRAFETGALGLHSQVKIRMDGKIVDTTLGRAEVNRVLPEPIRDYEVVIDRRAVKKIVMRCFHEYGWEKTADVLDDLKDLGFKYATYAGLTISLKDCLIPDEKVGIVRESQAAVLRIETMFKMGLSTEEERRDAVVRIWRRTVDDVERATMENLRSHLFNPVYGMVMSGARGGPDQVKQLCGMRGPMAGPSGEIIERPVISNFREGLDMMEYFISTHGGRKGAADTALKTADSGYLTRRLVDASSDTITREIDCGTTQGVDIDPFRFSKSEIMEAIEERIYGRVTALPVVDPSSGDVVADANQWITREMATLIGQLECELSTTSAADRERIMNTTKSMQDVRDPRSGRVLVRVDETVTARLLDALRGAKIKKIRVRPRIVIRSAMTCESTGGVCQLCYGYDMSNHQPVALGTAVGVIAAQSVGEPGTQLTMRTFHTGGVAGEDITQGLPRAEELFEARKTTKENEAGLSPLDGFVTSIVSTEAGHDQVEIMGELREVVLPAAILNVEEGDEVTIEDLIRTKSPCKGEVLIFRADDEGQEMLLLDTASGDRSYAIPHGATVKVETGDVVSAKDALTDRFNTEPVVAMRKARLELSEESDRVFRLISDGGEVVEYEIPYGGRLLVEPGETVEAGKAVTSRSKPIFVAADGEGTVIVLEDRIVVYNPEGGGLRIPLTRDISSLKGHGETVRVGEPIVRLEIPHADGVRVESIEADGETALVRVEPKSVVTTDKAVSARVGDKVEEGDLLTAGTVAPHTVLDTAGVQKARQYLMTEIHRVYRQQGVDINDKHLEVIIRQILNNIRIMDRGDSRFLLGDLVTLEEFNRENRTLATWNQDADKTRAEALGLPLAEDVADAERVMARSGEPLTEPILAAARKAKVDVVRVLRDEEPVEIIVAEKRLPNGVRELLRISKAALQTKGWLSAASFQRTTKVLAEAALRGETDEMEGLKPSIIVGKRIPSGTGFRPLAVAGVPVDVAVHVGEQTSGDESTQP